MKLSEQLQQELKSLEREKAEILEKIRLKNAEILEAINTESVFKIGDKVDVITSRGKEPGIFGGYRLKYGSFEPIVYKRKKDGSASKFEIWTYGREVVSVKG